MIKSFTFDDEAAWLEGRSKRCRVGSSELACLVGCGYASQSPYQLWSQKTNRVQVEFDQDTKNRLEAGKVGEPYARKMFELETGLQAHFDAKPTLRENDEYPAWWCTVDSWCFPPEFGGNQAVVELKIINPRDLWSYKEDSLPEKFTIQVQQQMAVMDCDHGFLCAVCGTECVVRHVPRHQRLIDALHAVSVQFLDLVENDVPPKIDGSDATTEIIKQQFPTVDPERIQFLSEEYAGLHERYERYHRIEKRAGEMKAMVANRVKAAMEDREYAVDTNGKCFSWKLGKRGRSFSRLEKTPPSVRIQRVAAEFGE